MIQIDPRALHSANIQVRVLTRINVTIDIATAATAVRNLNGYDVGTRQLRVDFSEKSGTGGAPSQTSKTDVNPPLSISQPIPL